jgi:hypothetical protein
VAYQCALTNRHWLSGVARSRIGRHSEMASHGEPLFSWVCAYRLWHRPFSGSYLYCQHGAPLDSVAPVLDSFLRRSLYLRRDKLRHWISAAVRGFRCRTDVRALDLNNSPTACSQLFPHPRRNSRPRQVVGRVHCRSAMGRLLGTSARFARSKRFKVEGRSESGLNKRSSQPPAVALKG